MAFTGVEEIYNGYNRKLFFTAEASNALPTDVSPTYTWTELGYDDSFSFNENENEAQKYNKRVKSHKKKGRKEYTFEVSQLYAGVDVSIFMFKQQEGTLKQVTYNDAGEIVEVNYFHKAYINSPQFNGGTDDGDDTVSASGDYSERFMYDSDASGAVLLFATDGSHVTP
jgi:hypothetical protein